MNIVAGDKIRFFVSVNSGEQDLDDLVVKRTQARGATAI
jgi:hypothetical protein